MNNTELAWFAGFFEGEGSVRLGSHNNRNGRKYATPCLDICQVNREPLERAQRLFPFGKIYGPYKHKGNRQPHYRFVVAGREKVIGVLDSIFEHLSERRRTQFHETLDAHKKLVNRPRLKPGPKKVTL